MKVGVFTNEMWENRQADSIGSSRIRGTWLVNNWPDAEIFEIGKKYDAIIFQKAYFLRLMKAYDGIKILDLCDPDWMSGRPVAECIQHCDAVTCSSKALVDFVKNLTDKPVVYIEDRVDMSVHAQKKEHKGEATGAVWFGYHNNQELLDGVLPTIKRLGLTLTVISDMPYVYRGSTQGVDEAWAKHNIVNVRYDQKSINEGIIHNGDFVLNPQPRHGKYRFKSMNKTLISWALGMPVAKDVAHVERFMHEDHRRQEAEKRLEEVRNVWSVEIASNNTRRLSRESLG